uniref:E3 UFM1-protein ligase 1 homolog n=1 Tax=Tanacetum cinerariifolium TaxID=118510 RepID=A0A699H056_TANCI|nr:E3 UFM1-protein ligase 1 homolog [Tanacetum cinerariifolium]
MPMLNVIKQEGSVQDYYDASIFSTRYLSLNEGFLIDLFIFGLQPKIEDRVKWFKPKSFSDAYALAKVQELTINLLKKIEEERDKVELLGSCSRGFVEMDEVDGDKFVENGFKHKKIVETHVGIDGDCKEDGKDRELESNESSPMVVNGAKNCEEDGKGHESESIGVVDDNIDLHNHGEEGIENKEVRVLVDFGCGESGKNMICSDMNKEVMDVVNEFQGSVKEGENGLETVIDKLMSKNGESLSPDKKLDACLGSHIGVELIEFSPTGIGVHRHEYDFEDQLWKYEKHKESLVRNRKECDGKQEGNKEDGEWVLGVHLFGKCHDLRLIGNQEWVNEGGDIDLIFVEVGGTECKFRHRKWNCDIWKWPLRKKDELESYTKLLEAKRALFRGEQLTSRLRSDVRRSSGGEVNYRTKKIFVGGLPITLTEEQLQQYFESYGVDGKKIVGLLGKLCEKQAQVVANDPLLMLIKGEVISDWYWNNVCEEINDRLQECSQIALAEIAAQLQVGSELLVNVLEPRIGSLLKADATRNGWWNGVAVRSYELYPRVFDGWDCKEGMRAYDKCLGLNTRCWFKKDVPRLCIEKYLKMFCKDAKENGVSIVSLSFEHEKWKFDVWRWPNRNKKKEETCYGICLLSPACSKYLQPETLKELKDLLILVQRFQLSSVVYQEEKFCHNSLGDGASQKKLQLLKLCSIVDDHRTKFQQRETETLDGWAFRKRFVFTRIVMMRS